MTSKSFGVKNIDVSNNLNVSGVGTFTTGLDLDGYLSDKANQQGTDGQILTSTGVGVSWSDISAVSSNSGSTGISFTDLNDTPGAYATTNPSDANKYVKVNSNADGLIFGSITTGDVGGFDDAVNDLIKTNEEIPYGNIINEPTHTFIGLNDTPSTYTNQGGKIVTVLQDHSGTQRLEFTDTVTLTKLVVSGPLVEKFTRISDTTSASLDLRDGNVFQLVLGSSATTVSFTNCPASSGEAYSFTLIVSNTATADVGITWPTSVKWAADTGATDYVPTRTKAAHKSDVWVFTTYDGGTTYLGVLASFGYNALSTS
jgi:hypothetical protein